MGCRCAGKVVSSKTAPFLSFDELHVDKTSKNNLLFVEVNEVLLERIQNYVSSIKSDRKGVNHHEVMALTSQQRMVQRELASLEFLITRERTIHR